MVPRLGRSSMVVTASLMLLVVGTTLPAVTLGMVYVYIDKSGRARTRTKERALRARAR